VDGSVSIAAANAWHNAANPLDVNGDGVVTSLDVLTAINYLNAQAVPVGLPSAPPVPAYYYDVNDDQACTALDILMVINRLNAQAVPVAAGESDDFASAPPTARRLAEGLCWARVPSPDNLRDRILADLATELSPLESVLTDLAGDIAAAWL
jgi:hypothetical protein